MDAETYSEYLSNDSYEPFTVSTVSVIEALAAL